MTQITLDALYVFLPKLAYAVIILVVGFFATKLLMKLLKKAFEKSKLDPLCHKFILSLLRIAIYIVLLITTLTMLGVPTTSMVAILSVAGLAISLAIQDSLANMAGGFLLLLSKPFKVGDFVDIDGVSGVVRRIQILQTKLTTVDNKEIFIPNRQASSTKIINFSAQQNRRLDLSFAISYSDDFEKAKTVISELVQKHTMAQSDPAPIVRVGELAASSVVIVCKVWVKNSDFWDLNFDLLEQGKTALGKAGMHIPFPQINVHSYNSIPPM